MSTRAWFIIIAAGTWLAACSEGIGPPPGSDLSVPDRALHHIRWSPTIGSPAFAAFHEAVGEGLWETAASSAGPILDTYQTSFWARRGAAASVEIRYRAADGTWRPYVALSIPKGGLYQRPDGSLFADGDAVLITVTVDPNSLVVQFEPTGLVFNQRHPAQLRIWYTGADPDFDGNGVVDATDAYIERVLLGVWLREDPDDDWEQVAATQSLGLKLFTADLRHFSRYAVSW